MNTDGGALYFDALIENSQFNQRIKDMESRILSLSSSTERESARMDAAFNKIAATLAGFFTIQAAQNFVSELIRVRGEFQQIEIAFTTMLKSKEKADKLMKEAVELAATTPFQLQEVASGAKQLLAYGFGAESVTSNLTTLGNIAAGVGAPLNDIVYLYGTLRTQGRAYAKDIQQFTGRGIPIIAELAKQFNVAESEVMGLVESGKVGFPQVEIAFQNMTGSAGIFYNLMQEQSKSLTGQISNLQDAWDSMLNELGKENQGILSGGIAAAAALVENYDTVLKSIEVLIVTYGVYRAALILNTIALSGMTAAETLHYGALVIAEKAQKLLNITTLSNPYVAVAVALGALISAVVIFGDELNAASKAQSTLNDINKQASGEFEVQRNKLSQLLVVANNEQLSKERRIKAIKDINKISPELLGNLTLENLKTREATAAIDDYIKSLEKSIKLKIAQDELETLIREQQKGPGFFDKALGVALSGGNVAQGLASVSNSFLEKNLASQAAVKKLINDLIAEEDKAITVETNKSTKTVSEQLKNINQEISKTKKNLKDALSPNAIYDRTKIEEYKNSLEDLTKQRDLLTGKTKEQTKAENKLGELLKQINEEEKEAFRKGLTKDEEEIQSAKDKYRILREEAKKQGAGSAVFTRIDNVERKVTGDISYSQDTEKLKNALDAQKQLYENYEAYKKEVGEQNANDRFKNEIDINKTYLQKLEELSKEFEGRKDLTGPEKERLIFLNQQIKEQNKLRKDADNQAFSDAFNASKNHKARLIDIEKEYQNRILKLGEKATEEQLKELKRQRDEKIKAENLSNLDAERNYVELFASFEKRTKEQVRIAIEAEKKILNAKLASGEIAQSDYNSRISQLDAQNEKFVTSTNNAFKKVSDAVKKYREAKSSGQDSSKEFKELAGAAGEAADLTSLLVDQIAILFEKTGVGDEVLQEQLKAYSEYSKGISQIGKGILTGDPVAIVQGAVQAITSAIDFFNTKDKKIQVKINAYKQQLKDLGKAYKQLERDVNNAVGEDYFTSSEAQIRNLQQQAKALQASIDAERGKKKADQAKIDAWQAQLDEIPFQIQDIQKAISEMLVQTNFKDFSNTLADALTDAFIAGEDGIASMDQAFDKAIQNIVKNSLKIKFLQKAVDGVLNDLSAYLQANNNDITGFDFDKAKETLNAAGAQFNSALSGFGDLFKNTTDPNKATNSLSGAIKGITADQADLLAGQFGGFRIAQLLNNEIATINGVTLREQNDILLRQLAMLAGIEVNTGKTANNTDRLFAIENYLKSMDDKIETAANALRAGGVKGP